jgi:HSP20 family molecular chaperone IbpA
MTDHTTDDDGDDPLDRLRDLLERLEAAGSERGEGSTERGPVRFDLEYGVGVGLGAGDRRHVGRGGRPRFTRGRRASRPSASRESNRSPETVDADAVESADYHVDVSETAEGYRLLADLPGVEREAVSLTVADGKATLRVDGEVLERVQVGDARVVERTFNNGVFLARIEEVAA